jgi:hypothetical protein
LVRLEAWGPIGISVLVLLIGDGLLVSLLNLYRERRQRYYRVLEELLVPLERFCAGTSN